MSEAKNIKSIKLASAKDGEITVAKLKNPYGEKSDDVLSIGISLKKGSEPEWKVHIPLDNIDDVIESLKAGKKELKKELDKKAKETKAACKDSDEKKTRAKCGSKSGAEMTEKKGRCGTKKTK